MDALDNIPSRMLDSGKGRGIEHPFIHGAIAGWYGQVSTIFPGDRTLDLLYAQSSQKDRVKPRQPFLHPPPLVASIQVSEALKVLTGGKLLRNKILYINTLDQEYQVLELK